MLGSALSLTGAKPYEAATTAASAASGVFMCSLRLDDGPIPFNEANGQ